MHFYDWLECENDYRFEYEKLEELCNKQFYYGSGRMISVNAWINEHFLEWHRRGKYTSYDEVILRLKSLYTGNDLEDYLRYVELILNLIKDLGIYCISELKEICRAISNTIVAVVSNAGLEVRETEKGIIVAEIDAAAIEVAAAVPQLADVIIEYNQYLLRGNIDRKKEILKRITDSLDPKRTDLKQYCNKTTDDYFDLVNNMNIRHNNVDPKGLRDYNPWFASMTTDEKEEVYDTIYQEALGLFIMLEHQKRKEIIAGWKKKMLEQKNELKQGSDPMEKL